MTKVPRVIAVADVGGTHARFALAELAPDGPPRLDGLRKYRTAEHDGLASAWAAFVRDGGVESPDAAAIAVAAPIEGDVLRFTNSDWAIDQRTIGAALGLERLLLLNDFGAVAHAASALPLAAFHPLAGPVAELPDEGAISVIGLGTGLGVSLVVRRGGRSEIVETEGGHIAFAPQTAAERRTEEAIRASRGRCSVERVVSGPGLSAISAALGASEEDAATLWEAGLNGTDAVAAEALDILTGALGAVAGDFSLAHGSSAVVIAGALGNRMRARLASPAFRERFVAKGRYRERMERVTVSLLSEPEPGLLGAAVAFQRRFDP